MNSYDIAVIGGDGTGPEVTRENIKVLDAAGQKFGFKLNYTEFDFGGERYMRTNAALPDSAADDLRHFPAILTSSRASSRKASCCGCASSSSSTSTFARSNCSTRGSAR